MLWLGFYCRVSAEGAARGGQGARGRAGQGASMHWLVFLVGCHMKARLAEGKARGAAEAKARAAELAKVRPCAGQGSL